MEWGRGDQTFCIYLHGRPVGFSFFTPEKYVNAFCIIDDHYRSVPKLLLIIKFGFFGILKYKSCLRFVFVQNVFLHV